MSLFQVASTSLRQFSATAPLSSSPRPLYFSSGRVVLAVDDVVLRLHPDVLSRGSNVFTQIWAQRPDLGRRDTMIRLYNDDPEDIVDLVDAVYMFESGLSYVAGLMGSGRSAFRCCGFNCAWVRIRLSTAQIRCGVRRADGTLTILPDIDRVRCVAGRQFLLDAQLDCTWAWLTEDSSAPCTTSVICQRLRAQLRQELLPPLSDATRSYTLLRALEPWCLGWSVALCSSCSCRARVLHELGREHIWNSLPGYFGLQPWEGLFAKEQESAGAPASTPVPHSRSTHNPEPLLFADGNLTLIAGDARVNVHAMVMSRESSVFESLWRKRPGLPSHCTVRLLNDTGASLIYLTNALYNVDRPFMDKTPVDMARFLGLLHMSLKFHYHSLLESLLQRVFDHFPSDVTDLDDARKATGLELAPGDEFDLIRAAGDFGFSTSLPAIYYRHQIRRGIPRPDGTFAALDQLDQVKCTVAREALIDAQMEQTWVWLVTEDASLHCMAPFECPAVRDTIRAFIFSSGSGRRYAQIRTLSHLHHDWSTALCESCRRHALFVYEAGRQSVWLDLPAMFGLSSWDDLVLSETQEIKAPPIHFEYVSN
ncbi:hypothetical protein DXG01_001088 [Tephrocybe rancida]|nr:hypothetical protein DXG01_001088 [Tephrocybe rancida]